MRRDDEAYGDAPPILALPEDEADEATTPTLHGDNAEENEDDRPLGTDAFRVPTLEELIAQDPHLYDRVPLNSKRERDYVAFLQKLQLIDLPTETFVRISNRIQRVVLESNSGRAGKITAIYGTTHSGKSHILGRLTYLKSLTPRDSDRGPILPCIWIDMPSKATQHALAIEILSKLDEGNDYRNPTKTITNAWNRARSFLRLRKTVLLVIDECDALSGSKERSLVLNGLRELTNDRDWPINLVLAGTKTYTRRIVSHFPTNSIRTAKYEVRPFGRDKKGKQGLVDFLKGIEAALGFPEASGLSKDDLPKRFYQASAGEAGIIAKLIFEAASSAVLRRGSKIELLELQLAYKETAAVGLEKNVFSVEAKDIQTCRLGLVENQDSPTIGASMTPIRGKQAASSEGSR